MGRAHLLLLPLVVGACDELPPDHDDACTVQLRDVIPIDPSETLSHWWIDTVDMPSTATEANEFGIDLDCDERAARTTPSVRSWPPSTQLGRAATWMRRSTP